jgi:hypothetical protein
VAGARRWRRRIWTFETSTSGWDDEQARMQSWAIGGAHDQAATIGQLEVGFARAACRLRRPKLVRALAATAWEPPPPPGELVVRRAGAEPEGAMLIIFDASGSMGAMVPGASSTRLTAARNVLAEMVAALEPGTPFALRAYGHVLPASCDTRLELPLGPLDHERAIQAIASIEPKLLSGTPLADAILAAIDDLAGAPGPATVVLLTDGEESCGGDPGAAIEALRRARPQTRVSIVAFDLASDDRDGAFGRFVRWAEAGGGAALQAGDVPELRRAMAEVLLAPPLEFEALDARGDLIAAGQVGGAAVELPVGSFEVRIRGGPTLGSVWIHPGGRTELVVEDEGAAD